MDLDKDDFAILCRDLTKEEVDRVHRLIHEWGIGPENSFPAQLSLLTRAQFKAAASMLPPPRFDVHRKYPVLIDQPVNDRCEPGPQFLADAGIFYVSVNRHGLASSDNLTTAFADALAVYDDLLKNPNIDPHRIYLAGACASTTIVSELVDNNPAMWRGMIVFGPNSFPEIPPQVTTFPSVFVSEGENDTPSYLTNSENFAQKASSQLIPMRIIYHNNAGHIFNSTTQAKERYGAVAKFILTDY